MSWSRNFWRRVSAPYMRNMSQERALRYLYAMRMAYFFSVSTLAYYMWHTYNENLQKVELESGKPQIKDHSEAHAALRKGGLDTGIIYKVSKGGVESVEFNKEEYYSQLQAEAYERAKKAQEKALAEGRELPEDAIRLV